MNDTSKDGTGYPPPTPPAYTSYSSDRPAGIRITDNTAAVWSYFTLLPALVFLVLPPYKNVQYIRFHAIQSICFWILAAAIHAALAMIPVAGVLLSLLATVFLVVMCIFTLLKAGHGEWYKLPIIGNFALEQSKRS